MLLLLYVCCASHPRSSERLCAHHSWLGQIARAKVRNVFQLEGTITWICVLRWGLEQREGSNRRCYRHIEVIAVFVQNRIFAKTPQHPPESPKTAMNKGMSIGGCWAQHPPDTHPWEKICPNSGAVQELRAS